MSSFTDILIVSPLSDGKKWVVRKEFSYYIYEEEGEKITVPVGFVTNFASIPQIFWSIIPRWDKYGKASIIHDYLYFSHEKTRKESDNIFYEAMLVAGVNKIKAKIMYFAVRIFGKKAYNDNSHCMIKTLESYIKINRIEWRK